MQTKNMQRLSAMAIGGLTAIALVLAMPTAANASDTSGAAPKVEVSLTPQQEVDIEAVMAASDFEAKTFDVGAASSAGATEQAIADHAAVLNAFGWTINGKVGAPSDGVVDIAAAALACSGFSGPHGYYFPWGYQFGLNSCQTSQLIAAVGLGAAGAGVVTAILAATGVGAVAAPISGIVLAVLAFGTAALAACQAFSSNGAIWLNVVGQPTVSCWGQ